MRAILISIFLFFISYNSNAQIACNFTLTATDTTIVCGDSTTITGIGLAANPALSTNFNGGGLGAGWASTQQPLYTNPCGPTLDGTPAAWFGAGVSPRTITTVGFDLSCGAQICFDLDFANDENAVDCEDPDAANEGVYFQYSIDNGLTWVDIFYFQPNATMSGPYYSWATYCFNLPAAAWTNNTMFQWTQIPTSGTNWDHWGLDNIVITPMNCGFSYDWGGIGNSTSDSTGVLTVGPTSTTNYVVNYTDGTTNCYDTITITVEPWEIQASTNDSSLVCGDCANLNAVPVNYNGLLYNESFSWSPILGLSDPGIPNPVACPTDTTTYVITVLDAITGCTASDSVSINVVPPEITSITGGGIYCPGDIIGDISVVATGNGNWSIDYTVDGSLNTATNNTNPINLGNQVGTYVVTSVSNNGCVNNVFATDSIVLNAQPDVLAFYGGDEYCPYDAVGNIFADVIGTGPWTIDYTLNGVAQTITSSSNPINFGNTPGVYVLTGISDAVCSNAATGTTTIVINPLPNVQAGADFISCDGDAITLSGSGAQSYVWDNGVSNGVSFVPPTTMTYTVVGTDANGCINTDQITVTVELLPVVSFTSDIIEGCEPLKVVFYNTSTAQSDFANCVWDFGDGSTGVSCDSIEHEFVSGGLYTIELTTTTINGCTNSDSYIDYLYVEDKPTVSFTASDNVVISLNTNVQFINYTIGAINYVWDMGDSTIYTSEHVSHDFPATHTSNYDVWLYAYSPLGCKDSSTWNVQVNQEIIFYIPNAFTPDGDEHNQIFQPIFTDGYDPFDYHFFIYNRWGELIWESHDDTVGWDGTYNGRIAPSGTYVWRVEFGDEFTDERYEHTGHVNILK